MTGNQIRRALLKAADCDEQSMLVCEASEFMNAIMPVVMAFVRKAEGREPSPRPKALCACGHIYGVHEGAGCCGPGCSCKEFCSFLGPTVAAAKRLDEG